MPRLHDFLQTYRLVVNIPRIGLTVHTRSQMHLPTCWTLIIRMSKSHFQVLHHAQPRVASLAHSLGMRRSGFAAQITGHTQRLATNRTLPLGARAYLTHTGSLGQNTAVNLRWVVIQALPVRVMCDSRALQLIG